MGELSRDPYPSPGRDLIQDLPDQVGPQIVKDSLGKGPFEFV